MWVYHTETMIPDPVTEDHPEQPAQETGNGSFFAAEETTRQGFDASSSARLGRAEPPATRSQLVRAASADAFALLYCAGLALAGVVYARGGSGVASGLGQLVARTQESLTAEAPAVLFGQQLFALGLPLTLALLAGLCALGQPFLYLLCGVRGLGVGLYSLALTLEQGKTGFLYYLCLCGLCDACAAAALCILCGKGAEASRAILSAATRPSLAENPALARDSSRLLRCYALFMLLVAFLCAANVLCGRFITL